MDTKSRLIQKFIWGLLTIGTFVLFYFLIPNSVYNISPVLFSIIGASLFALGLFMFLLRPILKDKDGKSNTNPRIILIVSSALIWLVMIFVFDMHYSSKEQRELEKFGVKVSGEIIDGKSYKKRNKGIYNVTIKFQTTDGKNYTVSENVGEDEFKNLYIGKKVELVYSSIDPNIIELLPNVSVANNNYKSEERAIVCNDLLKLLSLNIKERMTYLEEFSPGWKYNADSTYLYNAERYAIQSSDSAMLRMFSFGSEYWDFQEELQKLGFKAEEVSDKVKIFSSEDYTVVLETKMQDDLKVLNTTTIQRK